MTGKVFIDTNVLCYLYSDTEQLKRDECLNLIDELRKSTQLVWSTQVVQEFYNTLSQKRKISPYLVKLEIERFSRFELVINTMDTILRAIDIQQMNQLSFWDSLIVSAAKQAKCSYILSEDLNAGQVIEGMQIKTPFNF